MKDQKLDNFIFDTSEMIHTYCLRLYRKRKEYPADAPAMRLSRIEAASLYDCWNHITPTKEQATDTLEDESSYPLLFDSYQIGMSIKKENLILRYLNKINNIIENRVFQKSDSEYCLCPDFRCFAEEVKKFLQK